MIQVSPLRGPDMSLIVLYIIPEATKSRNTSPITLRDITEDTLIDSVEIAIFVSYSETLMGTSNNDFID